MGVASGVLLLVVSSLYLVMGTPPSLGNETLFSTYVTRSNTIAITTKLMDVFYLVGCYGVFALEELLSLLGTPVRESLLPEGKSTSSPYAPT